MIPPTLSEKLLASLSRDFFRPLTRPSAAIYVDCAERLAGVAGEAGRLPHTEAIALIREILAGHPEIVLDDDEGASLRDSRQRAGQIFNRLCDARWLEDQQLGLHERWALVSPGLRPLLRFLRELAEDEIAELKTFADTVRGVCETLERPGILDPRLHEPDALRATVTDVNFRLESAIIQLHGVEKLISLFDRRQRLSDSPAETLRLLYAEFGAGQHMVCYDALRRNGLLARLQVLRSQVAACRDDPLVKERLGAGLAAHYHWDESEAYHRAEKSLRDLEHRLAAIRLVADAIDARMASFNQLSQQRYRYQTELRGRRPEVVKAYCDAMRPSMAPEKPPASLPPPSPAIPTPAGTSNASPSNASEISNFKFPPMSSDPHWPRFWPEVPEDDRPALREVLAELLGRGTLLGSSGAGRDLFLLARDHYRGHLADYLAPLGLELVIDDDYLIERVTLPRPQEPWLRELFGASASVALQAASLAIVAEFSQGGHGRFPSEWAALCEALRRAFANARVRCARSPGAIRRFFAA